MVVVLTLSNAQLSTILAGLVWLDVVQRAGKDGDLASIALDAGLEAPMSGEALLALIDRLTDRAADAIVAERQAQHAAN